MRLFKFILIIELVLSCSLKAQTTDLPESKNIKRTVLSGSKAGISISSFSGEHASHYLISDLYGIFVNIPLSDKFNIQTELDLGLIGWGKSKNDKLTIPTLSWPLLLKYYPSKEFNFQFGGALNYLLMDVYVYDANYIQEGLFPYHRYDSGLIGGLGLDLSRIQVYFRYYQGLVNINPLTNVWVGINGESQFLDFTEKNRSFQFGIEYKLIKKNKKKKQSGYKYARPS